MKSEELIKRTKAFAHRCVKLATALPETTLGKHIRRQLIKCSTSVAANYRATCLSQSKASFIAKISIVLEETDEASVEETAEPSDEKKDKTSTEEAGQAPEEK